MGKCCQDGGYIIDGSVLQQKVGAFRVILYFARQKLDLPADILKIIDIFEEFEIIKSANNENKVLDKDFGYDGVNLKTTGIDFLEDVFQLRIHKLCRISKYYN